jgi:hemerythrin superfamily protein
MSSDAIVLLKEDHKTVKRLFREFERARQDTLRKQHLVSEIIAELTAHTYLENEIMYPMVRKFLPDLEDDVLESYEEHHVVDVLALELLELDPTNEHFDAKTTVLIENVRHHVEEEETDWFPKVRAGMSRKDLLDIGAQIELMRPSAPRDPREPKAMESAHKAITA